jgi:hypothetical protein
MCSHVWYAYDMTVETYAKLRHVVFMFHQFAHDSLLELQQLSQGHASKLAHAEAGTAAPKLNTLLKHNECIWGEHYLKVFECR